MKFEANKYYQHSGGRKLKILSKVNSVMYGECLVAEDTEGHLSYVGIGESYTQNYCEISKEEFFASPDITKAYIKFYGENNLNTDINKDTVLNLTIETYFEKFNFNNITFDTFKPIPITLDKDGNNYLSKPLRFSLISGKAVCITYQKDLMSNKITFHYGNNAYTLTLASILKDYLINQNKYVHIPYDATAHEFYGKQYFIDYIENILQTKNIQETYIVAFSVDNIEWLPLHSWSVTYLKSVDKMIHFMLIPKIQYEKI